MAPPPYGFGELIQEIRSTNLGFRVIGHGYKVLALQIFREWVCGIETKRHARRFFTG